MTSLTRLKKKKGFPVGFAHWDQNKVKAHCSSMIVSSILHPDITLGFKVQTTADNYRSKNNYSVIVICVAAIRKLLFYVINTKMFLCY